MENAVLLVLDAQVGILQRSIYEMDRILKNINAVVTSFHQRRFPVVFSRHTNATSLQLGSNAWQIDARLDCPQDAILLDKKHSNIFKEMAFRELVENNTIHHIFICGFVSNGCVQAACTEALRQRFDTVLVKDAHSTFVKNAEVIIELWNAKLADAGAEVISTEAAIVMV